MANIAFYFVLLLLINEGCVNECGGHTRAAFVCPAPLAAIKHSARDLKLALLYFYFILVGRNVYMPVVYLFIFFKEDKVNV